jgi:hypothetical protein
LSYSRLGRALLPRPSGRPRVARSEALAAKNDTDPLPISREELERRVGSWLNGARAPRLRERADKGKGPYEFDGEPGDSLIRCLRASGTPDPILQEVLFNQALDSGGSPGKYQKTHVQLWNEGAAILNAIAPNTPLEGLLATQMVAAHNLALALVKRAAWTDDRELHFKCSGLAAKVMRTFTGQLEALLRLRGQATKQVVRVEHVHVQLLWGARRASGGGRVRAANMTTAGSRLNAAYPRLAFPPWTIRSVESCNV